MVYFYVHIYDLTVHLCFTKCAAQNRVLHITFMRSKITDSIELYGSFYFSCYDFSVIYIQNYIYKR